MPFASQEELELATFSASAARGLRSMQSLEASGLASTTRYAQLIHSRFTLPLSERIAADFQDDRRRPHIRLTCDLDPKAVAFLAVREVLDVMLLRPAMAENSTSVCRSIGLVVYYEHLFQTIHDASGEFYAALIDDYTSLQSSIRHRTASAKARAEARGVVIQPWLPQERVQVGAWLIEHLIQLDFMVAQSITDYSSKGPKTRIVLAVTNQVAKLIGDAKHTLSTLLPSHLPMIERPLSWTTPREGGYHTEQMRRTSGFLVRSAPRGWKHYDGTKAPQVLSAVNALQDTRWSINKRVLQALKDCAKYLDFGEITGDDPLPKPVRPSWLDSGITAAEMDKEQGIEFMKWRRAKTQWHMDSKARNCRIGRLGVAVNVSEEFSEYDHLYFPYFLDFRGRAYARTSSINPQGSDMQKALLRFSEGQPLDSAEAVEWFLIHGANKFGFDKASLKERAEWTRENEELILAVAADPISNTGWIAADKPLQFLAWCQEYSDWHYDPDNFLSFISIGLDGSCNGLQNLSAMLRDEVGGRATNLLPTEKAQDVYAMVADLVTQRLLAIREENPALESIRLAWLAHGVTRKIVKRSVMTLPYGSTQYSAGTFIYDDYLKFGHMTQLEKRQWKPAARYLAKITWSAISEVVIKAREAMDWLQDSAKTIIKSGADSISWQTPTGFSPLQAYPKQSMVRVKTMLLGGAVIRLRVPTEGPDERRHINGLAPNFVHSMDASHMTRTVNALRARGVRSFHAVHDDFGTHARNTPLMFQEVRRQFVQMYQDFNPLWEFYERYKETGIAPPPAEGKLDLAGILESDFFFS